jgi:Fe-S-cluster containining protein
MAQDGGARDRRWVHAKVLGEGGLVLYGPLLEQMEELDPAEFWREFRRAAEDYLGGGADRSRVVQARVDALLETLIARDRRFGYPPPFCHKGCANCCHEPVYATSEEARTILDFCAREGIPVDRGRLERQLDHLVFDARGDHTGATTWHDQPDADQACVFLDPADRACRVWPVRPLVCRVHLAEGTDAHCRPHNGEPDPRARGIAYPEWSYILSAVFTIHHASIRKSLGKLLLDPAFQKPHE